MKTEFRGYIVAAVCAAGLAAVSGTARAQTYGDNFPVCLQVYAPIQYIECRYVSIPQCQATASGLGALCRENPFFAASAGPRRKRRL